MEILRHPRSSKEFRLIKEQIGSEELYVLLVQLAELSDWCLENDESPEESIGRLKRMASIILLDENICLDGSRIKRERRRKGHRAFGILDGLILAAARSMNEKLLSFDEDFQGEEDCIVLP